MIQEEPKPPWIVYPNTEPVWSGWRQGLGEHWLRNTWLPYLRSLSQDEKNKYFDRWVPPSRDWLMYALSWSQG
ncbi:MAG TPA: hypothetical protein V6C76_12620 [Drouetiella sp.]